MIVKLIPSVLEAEDGRLLTFLRRRLAGRRLGPERKSSL